MTKDLKTGKNIKCPECNSGKVTFKYYIALTEMTCSRCQHQWTISYDASHDKKHAQEIKKKE
jgi:uncharacterized protein (DUF983 family)